MGEDKKSKKEEDKKHKKEKEEDKKSKKEEEKKSKKEKEEDKKSKKEEEKKSRKERSRSRSRGRRRRDEDEDEEEDEEYQKRRHEERKKKEEAVQRREEQRQKEEEEQERQKMADDARRMDRTVMVVGLSTRADERDVFEFFSGRAGVVKDVQIIRDARTGKSKGVCFVEFSTAEGMVKSLGMTGQNIKGARVQVQQSQVAEGAHCMATSGLGQRMSIRAVTAASLLPQNFSLDKFQRVGLHISPVSQGSKLRPKRLGEMEKSLDGALPRRRVAPLSSENGGRTERGNKPPAEGPASGVGTPCFGGLDSGVDESPKVVKIAIQENCNILQVQPIQRVAIRQLLERSASVSDEHHLQHARWIQEEMPVRLAHRLSDFLQLPFVIVCNARFHEVFRLFLHAFDTLVESPPVKDTQDVEKFAQMLRQLVRGHDNTIHMLQEGYAELHALLEDLVELEAFLNQTCFTRIGNRVLAEHFLAVHEARISGTGSKDFVGVVDPECRPGELITDLSESLGDLCEELYGTRPKVHLEGELDTKLSFVPEHLNFMLQEILKNSFRATLETHLPSDPPPVTVEVLKGIFDVTIKVSDRGGGMLPEELREAWRYGQSCAKKPAVEVKPKDDFQLLCGRDAASMRQLAGYGFGLPLSRVYAQYFGGDIHVQTMHGFGTDVYLNVNHLGDVLENDGLEGHTRLVAS
eukprot:symbB.v1.2.010686.t1/scaffold685.1/size172784/4